VSLHYPVKRLELTVPCVWVIVYIRTRLSGAHERDQRAQFLLRRVAAVVRIPNMNHLYGQLTLHRMCSLNVRLLLPNVPVASFTLEIL